MTGKLMGFLICYTTAGVLGIVYSSLLSAFYTMFLVLFYPLYFLVISLAQKETDTAAVEAMKGYAQSAGYAEQAIKAIRVVCAFGQENTEILSYNRFLDHAKTKAEHASLKKAISSTLLNLSFLVFTLYAIVIAAMMINGSYNETSENPLSGGDVIGCYNGVLIGVMAFTMFLPNWKLLQEGKTAAALAFKVIESEQRPGSSSFDGMIPEWFANVQGAIEFKEVSFSFNNNKVLKNVSMPILPGKVTALVGVSGAGKSTILKLIQKLYEVSDGTILIDKKKISDLDQKEIRKLIGYVEQDPVLFNTSIQQNLLYAKPTATDDEMIHALSVARIYEFVQHSLPEGINTMLGNGIQFTAAQKQRIALARAYLMKPKILLLDEITSSLDEKNEKEMLQCIDAIRNDLGMLTTIIASRKLSSVRNADVILVLDKGKIAEVGSHEELLKNYKGGLYQRLLKQEERLDLIEEASPEREREDSKEYNLDESHQMLSGRVTRFRTSEDEGLALKELRDSFLKRFNRLGEFGQGWRSLGALGAILSGLHYPISGVTFGILLFTLMGAFGDDNTELVKQYVLVLLVLIVYLLLVQLLQRYSFGRFGQQLVFNLRGSLYKAILGQSISWFEKPENSPEALASILTNDTTRVNSIASDSLALVSEALASVVFGSVLASFYLWSVAIVTLTLGLIHVLSIVLMQYYQSNYSQVITQKQKQANSLATDCLCNYQLVASLGNGKQLVKQYEQLLCASYSDAQVKLFFGALLFGFSIFSKMSVSAIIFLQCGLIMQGNSELSSVDLYLAQMIVLFSLMAIYNGGTVSTEISHASTSADRIFRVLDEPSEINPLAFEEIPGHPQTSNQHEERLEGEIEFCNVWFSYPSNKEHWVLKNFNVRIRQNQMTAITGEAGSGKSAILELLLRFFDVDAGVITIDDIDIREIPLGYLRRQMGLITQSPVLFNYSIYENILYGQPHASNTEIIQASKQAFAFEFIEKYPTILDYNHIEESYSYLLAELRRFSGNIILNIGERKYKIIEEEIERLEQEEVNRVGKFENVLGVMDYRDFSKKNLKLNEGFYKDCGVKGCKVSLGQQQIICMARALIRNPAFLLLDESEELLDEETERKMQLILNQLKSRTTALIVAYKRSTLKKCDRIIMIRDGRVVEDGTYADLKNTKKQSAFLDLYDDL